MLLIAMFRRLPFRLSFSACLTLDRIWLLMLTNIRHCSLNWNVWERMLLFQSHTRHQCYLPQSFVSDMKEDSDSSDVESTARALAAALHTANKSRPLECDFCNRRGHTKDRCFVNPDNPDNHPPKQLLEKRSASSVHANAALQNKKKAGGFEKLEIAGMSITGNESSGPDPCPTFLDSGASAHCFQSSVQFVPGSLISCAPRVIALADKSTVVANQVGEVLLSFENANLRLTDVLLVPEMGYNLVSCGRLADKGIESRFSIESVSLVLVEKEFLIGSGCRQERNGICMYCRVQKCKVYFL